MFDQGRVNSPRLRGVEGKPREAGKGTLAGGLGGRRFHENVGRTGSSLAQYVCRTRRYCTLLQTADSNRERWVHILLQNWPPSWGANAEMERKSAMGKKSRRRGRPISARVRRLGGNDFIVSATTKLITNY